MTKRRLSQPQRTHRIIRRPHAAAIKRRVERSRTRGRAYGREGPEWGAMVGEGRARGGGRKGLS
jgi:hypothetical protein